MVKKKGNAGEKDLSYEEYMALIKGNQKKVKNKEGEATDLLEFPMFHMDAEELLKCCKGTVYGYVRVSTEHQDYSCQIEEMIKLGVREENIFKDKKSGKNFEREAYRELMRKIQPGDTIVVLSLDRFGRNMKEIKEQWDWIKRYRCANIVVIDQPILNIDPGMGSIGRFLSDFILQIFSLMAELERGLIKRRMDAGIQKAKLEGKKMGRKPLPIPEEFWKKKKEFLAGKISQNKASKELGVDAHTFKKWIQRTAQTRDRDEWGKIEETIEQKERLRRIEKAWGVYGVGGEFKEENDGNVRG